MLTGEGDRRTTIVVINDDPEFLKLMHDLLEDQRYRVEVCKAGEGAYGLVKEVQPDLVVLDIRLGDRSGWDVFQALKLDRATASIPILVCSVAAGELRDAERLVRQHDGDVLAKPFAIDTLLEKIARLTRRIEP